MTVALWIIAIVETIRMIEQSVQLRLIANDTGKRDNVYEELVKSFKASDREYVRNLLEAFDKQDEPQTETSTNTEKVQLKVQLSDEPQRDCDTCCFEDCDFRKDPCRACILGGSKWQPKTDCAWR